MKVIAVSWLIEDEYDLKEQDSQSVTAMESLSRRVGQAWGRFTFFAPKIRLSFRSCFTKKGKKEISTKQMFLGIRPS